MVWLGDKRITIITILVFSLSQRCTSEWRQAGAGAGREARSVHAATPLHDAGGPGVTSLRLRRSKSGLIGPPGLPPSLQSPIFTLFAVWSESLQFSSRCAHGHVPAFTSKLVGELLMV